MKNKKIIALFISFFTTLGLVSCGTNDSNNLNELPIETYIDGNIISHGMQIKSLSNGVDSNQHPYQTFSYVVLPSNSLLSDVDLSISFSGGSSCDEFVTLQHDASNKTVTLTCLQPFSTVINVHLESHYNNSVYADINVHYLPKYSQSISKVLDFSTVNEGNLYDFYDSRNVLSNSFEFDVSINTEGVLQNPRYPAHIYNVADNDKFRAARSDRTIEFNVSSSTGYCLPILNQNECSNFYNNSLYQNIYDQTVLSVFNSTGFSSDFPNLLLSPFVCYYQDDWDYNADSEYAAEDQTPGYAKNRIRSNILNWLNQSSSYNFSTYSKTDLIDSINKFFSDNSTFYVPISKLSFGKFSIVYESLTPVSYNFDPSIRITYADSTTENFSFAAGIFDVAKIKSPSAYSYSEFVLSSISSEASTINF